MAEELRIIGPPGCGKTTELARIAYGYGQDYGFERVMVCSLTKAAAAEIAGRNSMIPPQNIGTIHAFAWRSIGCPDRVVDSPNLIKEWNTWVDGAGYPEFVMNSGVDMDSVPLEATTDGAAKLFQDISICRARFLDPADLSDQHQKFLDLWENYKSETDGIDYMDMLYQALEVPYAPGRPAVIMGDEMQDTPTVAMKLIRHWAEDEECRHLVTTGDPLQALFCWAGSEWDAWLKPDIPSSQKRVLHQSYRVPIAVRDVAMNWIAPLRTRAEATFGQELVYEPRRAVVDASEDGIPVHGDLVAGSVEYTPHIRYRDPSTIIHTIEELLPQTRGEFNRYHGTYAERPVTIMVQASCAHMLLPLIGELRDLGIPFHNPWRRKNGSWNPLVRRKGTIVSAGDRIAAFLALQTEPMWSARQLWRWAEICTSAGLLARGAKAKLEIASSVGTTPLEPDGFFGYMDNVTVALDAMTAAQDGDLEWLSQHLLDSRRYEYPIAVARRGLHLLDEQPQVIVGTIHSLKGSEADIVLLFPDLALAGMSDWLHDGEERDGILRMFYVGMTRAADTLMLCGSSAGSAVRWA